MPVYNVVGTPDPKPLIESLAGRDLFAVDIAMNNVTGHIDKPFRVRLGQIRLLNWPNADFQYVPGGWYAFREYTPHGSLDAGNLTPAETLCYADTLAEAMSFYEETDKTMSEHFHHAYPPKFQVGQTVMVLPEFVIDRKHRKKPLYVKCIDDNHRNYGLSVAMDGDVTDWLSETMLRKATWQDILRSLSGDDLARFLDQNAGDKKTKKDWLTWLKSYPPIEQPED